MRDTAMESFPAASIFCWLRISDRSLEKVREKSLKANKTESSPFVILCKQHDLIKTRKQPRGFKLKSKFCKILKNHNLQFYWPTRGFLGLKRAINFLKNDKLESPTLYEKLKLLCNSVKTCFCSLLGIKIIRTFRNQINSQLLCKVLSTKMIVNYALRWLEESTAEHKGKLN